MSFPCPWGTGFFTTSFALQHTITRKHTWNLEEASRPLFTSVMYASRGAPTRCSPRAGSSLKTNPHPPGSTIQARSSRPNFDSPLAGNSHGPIPVTGIPWPNAFRSPRVECQASAGLKPRPPWLERKTFRRVRQQRVLLPLWTPHAARFRRTGRWSFRPSGGISPHHLIPGTRTIRGQYNSFPPGGRSRSSKVKLLAA